MTRRIATASLILALIVTLGVISSVTAQDFGASPWTAQFYNSTNFTNPVVVASYSALNLNWPGQPTDAAGTPLAAVPADNFSTIFTSTQTYGAGTYLFRVRSDDTARLTIDGFEIVNVTAPNTEVAVLVVLTAGAHVLQVQFVEFTGPAFLQVQWGLQGGNAATPGGPTFTPAPTAVPTATFLPPIAPGSLTATVIRASVLNIRDAPSTGGFRIGRILRGQTYAVVGRDEDARWFLLQLGGYQGWAYGYYLAFNRNEFTAPIVSGNVVLELVGQQDYGVRVQSQATLRLRAAPTVASMQTGRVVWGSFLPVVGRTADNVWYQVVWRGTVGWIYAPFVEILEGNINNVPIRG